MIVISALVPFLYPHLIVQPIGEFGSLGLGVNRHGLWVLYHGQRVFRFDLFYPATVLGALSLAYPLVEASRRRRARHSGFPVVLPDMPDSKS